MERVASQQGAGRFMGPNVLSWIQVLPFLVSFVPWWFCRRVTFAYDNDNVWFTCR